MLYATAIQSSFKSNKVTMYAAQAATFKTLFSSWFSTLALNSWSELIYLWNFILFFSYDTSLFNCLSFSALIGVLCGLLSFLFCFMDEIWTQEVSVLQVQDDSCSTCSYFCSFAIKTFVWLPTSCYWLLRSFLISCPRKALNSTGEITRALIVHLLRSCCFPLILCLTNILL